MNKNIEIKLNPLTDGFVENAVNKNAIRADRCTYHCNEWRPSTY